jgi:hypothetical protein
MDSENCLGKGWQNCLFVVIVESRAFQNSATDLSSFQPLSR